jgi:hypothetical protein
MNASPCWKWLRSPLVLAGLLFGVVLSCKAQSEPVFPIDAPCSLDDLQRMGPDQLYRLFTQAEVGRPFVGVAHGRLVYLADDRFPRLKVRMANSVWRGKASTEDGWFTNRWIGNFNWIASTWEIGPSWIDGRPAVVMEYPPKTPLFAPMHDELREVGPGIYLGPVFERYPCIRFRGYVALHLQECRPRK